MRKLIALVVLLLALAGILLTRTSTANNSFPTCGEARNEHYAGPCVTWIDANGVITGD
jgi:hypothetical protein